MTPKRSLFAQMVPQSNYSQPLNAYDLKIFIETAFKFGSEQQKLNLIIDTGSSWTWVKADKCADIDDCPNDGGAFHYLLSDTFVSTDQNKKIVYGDRTTEGQIVKDTVIATANEALMITNFPFIEVEG